MCFNYFCIGLPSAETQIVGLPCFFYFKSPDLLLKPNRIFTAFTLFRFSETSYLYTANNSKQNLFFSCLNAYAHCYCILNFALNRFISTTLGFFWPIAFYVWDLKSPGFPKAWNIACADVRKSVFAVPPSLSSVLWQIGSHSRYLTIRFVCPDLPIRENLLNLFQYLFYPFDLNIRFFLLRRLFDIYQLSEPSIPDFTDLESLPHGFTDRFFLAIYYPRHNVPRIIYCCVSLTIGPTNFLCNICLSAPTAFFHTPRRSIWITHNLRPKLFSFASFPACVSCFSLLPLDLRLQIFGFSLLLWSLFRERFRFERRNKTLGLTPDAFFRSGSHYASLPNDQSDLWKSKAAFPRVPTSCTFSPSESWILNLESILRAGTYSICFLKLFWVSAWERFLIFPIYFASLEEAVLFFYVTLPSRTAFC